MKSKETRDGAGLTFVDKRHIEIFEGGTFSNIFNQIWVLK